MVKSIQAMNNMEYMLYGNTSAYGNSAVPSMFNNYYMQSNSLYGNQYINPYTNPYMNQYTNPSIYGGYNSSFGQNIDQYTSTQQGQGNSANNAFAGLTKGEQDALVKDYTKSLAPSESLVGCAAGATAFSVLFHPRVIAHPINTIKSFGKTKELFADVAKKGTNLAEGWAQPGTNQILRDAYTAMNRIDARSLKGKGLHIWRRPFAENEYGTIKNVMKEALAKFDVNDEKTIKEVIEATEKLNQANVKDGLIKQTFNWFRNLGRRIIGKEPVKISTATEAMQNTEAVKKAVTQTYEKFGIEAGATAKAIQGGKTYLQTLKSSTGGVLGAALMIGGEFLGSLDKLKAAFKKDNKTGMKQVGQTTVKALGSAAGWIAGEALGTWGCAKLLAAAGTAIAPGIGTAIGAVAGMIVGSIGSCLVGRITKKIVGQDVGDKVQAEQLTTTQEGQVQLLTNTIQRIQKGEEVDPMAQQAAMKLYPMLTQNTTLT